MPRPQPPLPQDDPTDLFPIRTVSSLTGINAITLRAWERRHGLIRPMRTKSGHRLYRRSDIDTILRIVALLDRGMSIGQVSQALPPEQSAVGRANSKPDHWGLIRNEMIEAISQFDEDRLEDAYDGAQARYRDELVLNHVLAPLMVELGLRWASATGSVAEEHFFSAYLRNKLGARLHHRTRRTQGPRLIAACLPGEFHEVGLLLFCLALHERGYRPILLGADMPLEELPMAARRSHCAAMVLSGSVRANASIFGDPLARLVAQAGVPVMLGGHCTLVRHEALVRAGAISIGSDIPAAVKCVAEHLPLALEKV